MAAASNCLRGITKVSRAITRSHSSGKHFVEPEMSMGRNFRISPYLRSIWFETQVYLQTRYPHPTFAGLTFIPARMKNPYLFTG
jgi:hypothetical protein